MTILLVRPKPDKASIGLQTFMICEPLELEYLSAYVEPLGHKVAIVDMILEKRSLAYFLRQHVPDVVGFTGYITHVGVIKEYAQQVKQYDPKIVTVVGGVHAEVVPGDFEDSAIDFIVHVNGLPSFAALLVALSRDEHYDRIRQEVPGIWNGPAKHYPRPDEQFDWPLPDRTKTQAYRARYNYIFHNRCATLKASFGCPYHCDFCFCIEVTRHHYFERDIREVVEELKRIREQNVFIVDDCFLLNPKRVEMFCDLLEQEDIHKHFILFGRTDFIAAHPDVIRRFARLGLDAVFMGLESFREEELEEMNKALSVEDNVKALRILEDCGIECHCGIIASPDWKPKDFDFLVSWLRRFKMIFANIQPLTPMPGTPLYERLKDQIVISRERYPEWDMAHLIVPPRHMSRRRFYACILRAYYRTSAGLCGHRYIWRKYGRETYCRILKGSLYVTWQYIKMWLRG